MAKTPEVVSAADHIQAAATEWSQTFLPYMLSLVTAIVVLIAGFVAARFVSGIIRARMEKIEKIDKTLIPVVAQLSHYTILVFTLILVLAEFGIQTTSIIAVLGAAGLAIGLALQGTLQNVAAGIMLLVIRPFQVGDYIEAGGASATVDEIGLFMTRMHTPQGIFIAVPNSKIWADTIVNYSKRAVRRLDILVGISYDDDIDHAVEVLMDLLNKESRILNRPEPLVVVKGLGESSVDIEIRAWTKSKEYWAINFDLIRAIKYRLDEEEISIPYPHRQVIMQDISEST